MAMAKLKRLRTRAFFIGQAALSRLPIAHHHSSAGGVVGPSLGDLGARLSELVDECFFRGGFRRVGLVGRVEDKRRKMEGKGDWTTI